MSLKIVAQHVLYIKYKTECNVIYKPDQNEVKGRGI